jgi:hypothetical protein
MLVRFRPPNLLSDPMHLSKRSSFGPLSPQRHWPRSILAPLRLSPKWASGPTLCDFWTACIQSTRSSMSLCSSLRSQTPFGSGPSHLRHQSKLTAKPSTRYPKYLTPRPTGCRDCTGSPNLFAERILEANLLSDRKH